MQITQQTIEQVLKYMTARHLNEKQSKDSVAYKCRRCKDTGQILYEDENGYEFARECNCGIWQGKLMQNKLDFAEIPPAFQGYGIASFETEVYTTKEGREQGRMAKIICQNYVNIFPEMQQRAKGLYFYSRVKGSGKTRMAASIANEIIRQYRISVKFATTLQILDQIRATWRQSGELTEQQLIQDIIRVPVIILDDMGVEKSTEWVEERFYHILDSRLKENKITIFTSNCRIEELKLDDRIKNRILKMALPIPFPNEPVRANLAKKENSYLLKKLL